MNPCTVPGERSPSKEELSKGEDWATGAASPGEEENTSNTGGSLLPVVPSEESTLLSFLCAVISLADTLIHFSSSVTLLIWPKVMIL